MDLVDFYDGIQNPLDDPIKLDKIIKLYADYYGKGVGIYGRLVSTTKKENAGKYYKSHLDRFYAMLFNKWKNNIISMTREEFMELYRNGSYGADFVELRKYLKNISDVSSKEEADKILHGKKEDKVLEKAFERYSWDSFGKDSGWIHICSRYLTAKKDKYQNVEHRFYLNIDPLDIYNMCYYFIEKCDKYHLPYYFKFDNFGDRDDTIVIYSDSNNLLKYLDILKEIKFEHPELIARVQEPPVLTGLVDGWIGYGSEPPKTPNGENRSFNEVRAETIEKSIDVVLKNWIINNKNMLVPYNGRKISFIDYIVIKCADNLISDLKYCLDIHAKYLNEHASFYDKNNIGTYRKPESMERYMESKGYTYADLKSPKFKQYVLNSIKFSVINNVNNFCSGKEVSGINLNVRNGKRVTIGAYTFKQMLSGLAVDIDTIDKNFATLVKNKIKEDAKGYGVDGEKYCFDIQATKNIEKLRSTRKADMSQGKITSVHQNKQIKTTTESIKDGNDNFLLLINKLRNSKINTMVKLPNGDEMPAVKYIHDVVYPYLPESGFVLLKNGLIVTVVNFIEIYVLGECQRLYNGDFLRYLTLKTKNNNGVISISSNDSRLDINPINIVDYINPYFLNMNVKLPNGSVISGMRYIQDVYAPYIPYDGVVTLSNGSRIPVTQYIEEVLFYEGQTKYNGDISRILYNTTRNNIGNLNLDFGNVYDKTNQINRPTEYIKKNNINVYGR